MIESKDGMTRPAISAGPGPLETDRTKAWPRLVAHPDHYAPVQVEDRRKKVTALARFVSGATARMKSMLSRHGAAVKGQAARM